MEWPEAPGEEIKQEPGEFLNGAALYAGRFAEVAAVLNGGSAA